MKRKFYFIKDTVSGQFYTGQENDLADFSEAAVYYSEASAKKKMKVLTDDWEFDHEYSDGWLKEKGTDKKWAKEKNKNASKRKNLPLWGMEIVSVEVKAP